MKTTNLSLILLLLLFNSLSLAQRWSWVNPYPTGEQINQSYFLDEQNGFVIGNNGTLARTTNGGTTWDLLETSINGNFIKITFYDNLNGWILGTSVDPYYNPTPFFLRTIDGGVTWEQRTITSFNVYLTDMFFLNNNIGWVVGNEGKIFKTTDGGLSWTDKSIQQLNSTSFKSIIFRNENEGIISGYTEYPYKFIVGYSINGGNSWNIKYSPFYVEGGQFKTNITLDSVFITTGTSGIILRSFDKCNSWSFCMDTPIEELFCSDFLEDGTGIAGADSGYFLKTSNGGNNWVRQYTGYSFWFNSVQCATENVFSASGTDNQYSPTYPFILTSTDAGNSWNNHTRLISNPISINGIGVSDNQNAFICGSHNYPSFYIYKTSDAGLNWYQSYTSTNDELTDIEMLDSNTVFACGSRNYMDGLVLKSTNNGQDWSSQTISSIYSIKGLSLPDFDGIYAFTSERILKSTDLGQNWNTNYLPSYPDFKDMDFVSSDVGFVIGGWYPSKLYKTTNGGANWTINDISSTSDVWFMSFPSENVGYAGGYSNIYKTINGGVSWSQIYVSNEYSFNDIVFNDELNGWIMGYNGIYHTTNGGQSWIKEFNKSGYLLNKFGIKRVKSLWVAGENCKILRYNGDLVTSVSFNQNDVLPKEFALLPNYPNPFNPITTIRYDVAKASQVSLKIYNVLGEEVLTLVNDFLPPGRYSVEWNAGSVASGVYLYTIQAADFIQTKKMILLK